MSLILIAGEQPLYRLSLVELLRQYRADLQVAETESPALFSGHELRTAELLICCCNAAVEYSPTEWQRLKKRYPQLRLLLVSDRLGRDHRRMLLTGTLDLVLPMAMTWQQAQLNLQRFLMSGDEFDGLDALRDPALLDRFLPDMVRDLTQQEQRVLGHVRQGLSNEAIADCMALQRNTVKVHLARICRKAGVRNRTQAASIYGQLLAC